MHTRLLIAMSALNEADNIGSVIQAIRDTLGDGTDILVVDDGSSDGTGDIVREYGVPVMEHAKTLGLGASFRDILRFALRRGTDLLVTIDADGQFDPREIPSLIQPIMEGRADFVAGSRFSSAQSIRPEYMSVVRYYGNLCMNSLIRRITGKPVTDASSGFRAYSREALLQLNLHSSFTYTQETFLDLATKDIVIEQVPVSVVYHENRRSRIARNVARYAIRSSATILRTVRDHRPLLIFGTPAVLFCLLGIAAGGFTVYHFLKTGSFSPYIFVAFSGAYLFTLGLVIGIIGVASDMLRPVRRNQEEMLYLLKHQRYHPDRNQTGE